MITPFSDDSLILLTERQAAQLLGFTPRALQAWRRTGAGPRYIFISARAVRYRRSDLSTWIDARVRKSTSDKGEVSNGC